MPSGARGRSPSLPPRQSKPSRGHSIRLSPSATGCETARGTTGTRSRWTGQTSRAAAGDFYYRGKCRHAGELEKALARGGAIPRSSSRLLDRPRGAARPEPPLSLRPSRCPPRAPNAPSGLPLRRPRVRLPGGEQNYGRAWPGATRGAHATVGRMTAWAPVGVHRLGRSQTT